jgi:ABC-type lipoprotein export system ATPase subunit
MTPIIQLNEVTKEYTLGKTRVQALRGVNLTLAQGKTYAIVGPSGSGKSTLLHILGCMDTPSQGEVWINGQPVHGLSERTRTTLRSHHIGFVFQAFHLNPILTVSENVSIVLQFLGVRKSEAKQRSEAWLERVGLAHRLRHYPSELSGGERQRVAIARAVVKDPALILADEPTGNLDSQTGHAIIALLGEINRERRTTIVLVTHDREIATMCDEIINFRDGMIIPL